MPILTKNELENLTGTKQTSKQRQVLERAGIYYVEQWGGGIVTTWEHVNNPRGFRANNDAEPDFDKIA